MTHLDSIAADPSPARPSSELTRFTAIEIRRRRSRVGDLAFGALVIAAGVVALAIVVTAAGVVLAR